MTAARIAMFEKVKEKIAFEGKQGQAFLAEYTGKGRGSYKKSNGLH